MFGQRELFPRVAAGLWPSIWVIWPLDLSRTDLHIFLGFLGFPLLHISLLFPSLFVVVHMSMCHVFTIARSDMNILVYQTHFLPCRMCVFLLLSLLMFSIFILFFVAPCAKWLVPCWDLISFIFVSILYLIPFLCLIGLGMFVRKWEKHQRSTNCRSTWATKS